MFLSAQLTALRMVVAGTQVVVPSSDESDDQRPDDVDDGRDAEIVRTTRLEAAPPRDTPDKEIPASGVGAFVVGDSPNEWIESDDAVDTEEFR